MLEQEIPMKWVAVIFSTLAACMIFGWWHIATPSVAAQNSRAMPMHEQIMAAVIPAKGKHLFSTTVELDPKKFPELVQNACFAAKTGYDKWSNKQFGKGGDYDYGNPFGNTCTNLVLTSDSEDKVPSVYVSIDFEAWRGVYKWRLEWELKSNDGVNFDPDFSYGKEVNLHVVTGR